MLVNGAHEWAANHTLVTAMRDEAQRNSNRFKSWMVNELRLSRTAARAECIFSRRNAISGTGSFSSGGFCRFLPRTDVDYVGEGVINSMIALTSSPSKS